MRTTASAPGRGSLWTWRGPSSRVRRAACCGALEAWSQLGFNTVAGTVKSLAVANHADEWRSLGFGRPDWHAADQNDSRFVTTGHDNELDWQSRFQVTGKTNNLYLNCVSNLSYNTRIIIIIIMSVVRPN